jgi:MFS family permease
LIATTRIPSTTSPFAKLAIAYGVGFCGDVFVTVALADSLFFSVGTDAARPKVLLYLLLTMAPFAVIAPFLGPLLDRTRGGRRLLISFACAGRAVLCLMMAENINGLLLYPLAFGALVLSKAQSITKSSLVPAVVDDESELVRANSRLALIAVFAGLVGGVPAAAILKLTSGAWVLRTGSVIFIIGTIAALGIPRAARVARAETEAERRALHVPSIVSAGSAMAMLRGVVGFVTFFAAFRLKAEHEPAWVYGALLAASAIGNGFGTIVAPQLRRWVREEFILIGSLIVPGVMLIFLARSYNRTALLGAGFLIATGAAAGRLGFDSLVQRDGPDAARGRAFARFETRFQMVWVGGALIAVAFPFGGKFGVFLIALVMLGTGLTYLGSVRRPAHTVETDEPPWRRRAARVLAKRRPGHRAPAEPPPDDAR